MSGLIPDAELAQLRADAQSGFDTSATIQRATVGSAYGYATQTWNTVASVLTGLSKPSARIQALYAARIGSLDSWTVRLPYGTDVRQNDRILAAGQTLAVQADLSVSSYSACVSVLATEVREV